MTGVSPPFDFKRYNPAAVKLAGIPPDTRDIPLRAKSVCLSERPRSKYDRTVRSADTRYRCTAKQFLQHRPQSNTKRPQKTTKVLVKQQKRKAIEKVPCAISVQTLSIPMKYAEPSHSTSKTNQIFCSATRIDSYITKSSNPPKQVGDNKRLCSTVGCGKETENKLLLQISEARQVSDFERILNSNAIHCERARNQVWRGCGAYAASAAVVPRPRSSYSLQAVSQAYHFLFRRHEESLQPLIDHYRRAAAEDHQSCSHESLLQDNWFENLQNLSEYYEDDPALQQEIENITDKVITEEIKTVEATPKSSGRNKNFNVNLTGLLGLQVSGEGFSRDGLSPDADRGTDNEVYDEKEWLAPIMSANSDDRQDSQDKSDSSVDCLAQNLNSVKIDSDGKVPTITFSNCCDNCSRSDRPNNSNRAVHLSVPSIESIDESRPPII